MRIGSSKPSGEISYSKSTEYRSSGHRKNSNTSSVHKSNERPGRGRFQITPDNRLFVFFFVSGSNAAGKSVSENRLLEILPDGSVGNAVTVPRKKPFTDFFTATVRAGSPPSRTLELLGTPQGSNSTISFARIRID
jgi:hypothetical protein